MKLAAIVFATALVPAAAFAGPNQPDTQPQPSQPQPSNAGTYDTQSSTNGLGVKVTPMTADLRGHYGAPRDAGMLITKVDKDSPAERAGIRVGDVLTRVGNDKVTTADQIDSSMAKLDKDQKLNIEVIRDHKMMTLQATPTSPASDQKPAP